MTSRPTPRRLSAALLILACLGAAPAPAAAALGDERLQPGDKGDDVRALQRLLGELGIPIHVDGVYGRGTARKVRRLERRSRWRVDGRVSPRQAGRMLALRHGGLAAVPPSPPAGERAVLTPDGRTAVAPASAPPPVRAVIDAANRLTQKPYVWGGGHGSWEDKGYDCSGAVSYALHGGGLLSEPLASGPLMRWGQSGAGSWLTIYSHADHVYLMVAGLRFDTSGRGEEGPRWRPEPRSSRGFTARHWEGL